eukprot:TRINITY_DN25780_c0_g1_i1.p1 TRINITY_DN25780_c0_g1~~TRINITY_DN25780_c0_g1_i1.p1  ORF type:complete len:325 (-),score=41.55 TRINITY_DN25780_c0_g1_i1:364-1338(-)
MSGSADLDASLEPDSANTSNLDEIKTRKRTADDLEAADATDAPRSPSRDRTRQKVAAAETCEDRLRTHVERIRLPCPRDDWLRPRLAPSGANSSCSPSSEDFVLQVNILSDPCREYRQGVGARFWPASRVLAQALLRPTLLGADCAALLEYKVGQMRRLRVLELGAGTALPSICLASRDHTVVISDLPEILPVTRANVEANSSLYREADVSVLPLTFGDEEAAQQLGYFNLIVGSDVAYDPVSYEPLLRTLRAVRGDWLALLAISDRSDELGEETFWNYCLDENVEIQCRYTASVRDGIEGPRHINIFALSASSLRRDMNGQVD